MPLHAYAHTNASRLERPAIADDRTLDGLIEESRTDLAQDFDLVSALDSLLHLDDHPGKRWGASWI
jgi:hypothetical protein